ncbi:MAG TPA: ABC transporter permease [Opitutaceae bacterium]|nr:ABC transporter permease [Opitutaceae bacterium]
MHALLRPFRRLRRLLFRRATETEMDEEMRHHFETEVERNVAAGMSREEARYAAQRSFGGLDQIKERCRDERQWVWISQLGQDLRYAFQGLRNHPWFTAVAVLALALGIGANTAIFSVVHAVLLRPLPYPEQDRLVVINESTAQQPNVSVSFPNFVDWRARQHSLVAIGVARGQSFTDVAPGGAERLSGAQASHDLFTALGISAWRGRLFTADDDRPGANPTVVIRESYWQRRFGGRDSAVGETVQLNGVTHTIIGVMPESVQWPTQTEVWVPLGLSVDHPSYQNRGNHPGLYAVGRLKPGVTLEAARADLRAVADQLAREYPASNAGQSVAVQSLPDRAFGSVAPILYLLLGAAAFVLLIACANVANLQLARAQARGREFAVRAALGAGRGRLIRQVLAESLLLGAFGGVAGLLVGGWSLAGLRSVLPANMPRLTEINLDGWVLAGAIGAGLVTTTAFGLIPALHAGRLDLREALAQGNRTAARGNRWRTWLIVGEFALTSVLLVGASLMLRTLANLYRADPGFSTERVVTFNWALPSLTTYAEPSKRVAVVERALARLAEVPGVVQASVVSPLPLGGSGNNGAFYVESAPPATLSEAPWCERAHVSSGYFATLEIPLVDGRVFDLRDTLAAPRVAIVDGEFAKKYFPNGAVGQRFAYGNKPPAAESDWHRIVGVVAHIQNNGPVGATRLQTYVPFTQLPPVAMSFAVRTPQAFAAIMPALRATMREVDPELPIYGESTLDALFATNIATPRLTSMLLVAFAGLGLVLSAFGLYGVLSYLVGQRTREIGVRLALGAEPRDVVRLMVRQGMKLAGFGLLLGLLAALGLTRLLTRVLYEVSPLDAQSYVTVAVVLAIVGALACWLPARRAAKVAPMIALRTE